MSSSFPQNKSSLILITQSFPFGLAESSFLKEEIKSLAQKFNVHIVSRNVKEEQYVDVPHNVVIHRYNVASGYNMLALFICSLFTIEPYRELALLLRNRKFNFYRLKKSITVQMRTLHFRRFLSAVRKKIEGNVILYSYWNEYSCFAATRVKEKGDMVVTRLHGGDLYELGINRNYQPYKCIYNKKVDLFSFISNKGLTYFNETYYNVSDKAFVNYLGVPEHKTSYTFTEREDIRIVSFSYVRDIKRIDRIIDCLSTIEKLNVKWVHIGGRYLFDQIKEYAKQKLSGKDNIYYEFMGEMKNEKALSYIAAHEFDFLVNVSSTEGMPMTMMEAFSMSLPVIGTRVGGVPEVVKHGINGYLLDVNFSNKDFVDVLASYASLPYSVKCDFRENAKETWKSNFYDIRNYDSFTDLLMEKCKLKNL